MNRLSRGVVVAALALGLLPAAGLSPAYACSCAATDDAGYLERADVVFRGTVAREPEKAPASPADLILVFRATRAYKGKVAQRMEVRTDYQGTACGLDLTVPGMYVVFATRPGQVGQAGGPGDPELYAHSCGGTRATRRGEVPAFGRGKPVAAAGEDGRGGRDGASERPEAAAAGAALDVLRDLLGWLTPAVGHVLDAVDRAAALAAARAGSDPAPAAGQPAR